MFARDQPSNKRKTLEWILQIMAFLILFIGDTIFPDLKRRIFFSDSISRKAHQVLYFLFPPRKHTNGFDFNLLLFN